jgi:hypothetical protein
MPKKIIPDYSKLTIAGLENRSNYSESKGELYKAITLYFLIFLCSVATSGYGSYVAGSIMGMILIGVIEIIRWSSVKSNNKKGLIIATTFSVLTAATSGWLFHQTHNKNASNTIQIIEQKQQEYDSIKVPDMSSSQLVQVRNNIMSIQDKLNEILANTYRIKQWSKTRKMTGLQIKGIKNCGRSSDCRKIQAKIFAYEEQIRNFSEKQNVINVGLQEIENKIARKTTLQNEITELKQNDSQIIFPLAISILIMGMLIFGIDYGLFTMGLQINTLKPKVKLLKHEYKAWQIEQRNKSKQQVKSTIKDAIVSPKVKKTPKKEWNEQAMQTIVNSVVNAGDKFTIEGVKKHLRFHDHGISTDKAKSVINYYKEEKHV